MRRALIAAMVTLWQLSPAAADIVVMTTGDFLKVESYEVFDGSIRVELPLGGSMILPLENVQSILDDEWVAEGPRARDYDMSDVELQFDAGQPLPETQFAEMFFEVGRRYSLNPRLLASIAQTESAFEPWARSSKGAVGLMQVMPATAQRFGVDPGQLFDPLICLDVGARYLTELRRLYRGDVALMLAAYNAGEATVERFGGVPPYEETQTYIRRVHRVYLEGPRG